MDKDAKKIILDSGALAILFGFRPPDMLAGVALTTFKDLNGGYFNSSRADLSDLGEPYLSMARKQLQDKSK